MRLCKEFLGKIVGGGNEKHNVKTITIGVLGASRGVGNTYFCIMLCNYLANVLGEKTALIEQNHHSIVPCLRWMNESTRDEILKCMAVNIFEANNIDIPEIMSKDYKYVIFDISADYLAGIGEFSRSDLKFIVCGMVPWKIHEIRYVLEKFNEEVISYVSLTNNFECSKKIKQEFGVSVDTIPYEQDAFHLAPNTCIWLRKKLEVVLDNRL